jgi:hypothetical protein
VLAAGIGWSTVTPEPVAAASYSVARAQRLQPAAGVDGASGFRVRTFELRALGWHQLSPAGDQLPRVEMAPPLDRDGLPMVRVDGRLYYSPTDLAMNGVRRLGAYVQTGNRAYLNVVLRLAAKLRSLAVRRDGAIWLPFQYYAVGNDMHPPWYNALAQGSALSLFSRLHRLRGRNEDLAFAHGLFRSFVNRRRSPTNWVAHVDSSRHLWFEHWPGGTHGRVLNAHAEAVFGLRDYWQQVRTPEARRMVEGGLTTLRERADQFRRPGTYSWYCLVNRVAHARPYHRWHIQQLQSMTVVSGDRWFASLAQRLASDWP